MIYTSKSISTNINISTYIKVGDEFIDIFQYEGDIKDIDYIDGALELTINGKPLITKLMWDYIDQIWSYFSKGLSLVYENQEFKCYFPDQPIDVKFIPLKGHKRVCVSISSHILPEVKTSIEKNEFLIEMRDHAIKFFERLEYLKSSTMGTRVAAMRYLEKINL
ncbi:hypothetical protein PSI23_21455 [Xenorhabdus sp. XENO-10]|uniref:Uncharacterized protein n=1 Tax=Xenorhabdus yunnanensis TaxID=3025878 RepID=A0ABT5LKX3_9GAMM|nr:hypothetical protein [Xenorhabdus yunnanensis]MDC9591772.1 hypothetical protein [Xenorhabdus yunnanensis]